MIPDTPGKVHFIGIAGKGISATALLLRDLGWQVSGSDEGFYPPVSEYLERAAIPFHNGYKAEHIPADADIIVIGKNAKLVPESNEEVRAAFESRKTVLSFPDVLEHLTKGTDAVVVAGSYGKSTCTALLAWCLKVSGKDPSYFIGEIVNGFESHSHRGKGNIFILEGDEYPSSNWDSSSKFLHYHPRTVLLTSATHDHINVYPTHEAYLEPFKKLIQALPTDGLLVVNASEPHAKKLSDEYTGKKVVYSLSDPQGWHAQNIVYGMPSHFDLYQGDIFHCTLKTSLLGAHNIENVIGVSAVLLEKGLLSSSESAEGIESFQGVKRRLEQLSLKSQIPSMEGFGSSYEKAKSAIAAVRLHFPNRKLVIIFEPHTFSWRNLNALHWYDDVFAGARKVYIFEPATQGASTHQQLSQEEIVERVQQAGYTAEAISDPEKTLSLLQRELHPDDVVLLLTSGNLGGLIVSIPRMLEEQFPKAL